MKPVGAVIGYARVSTGDQNPASQEQKLLEAGAERIFTDHGASCRVRERPQWQACLDYLRPGDTLVAVSLDRLAGSTLMALQIVSELGERSIDIRSLSEPEIDTTTPMGRALFGVVAVFVQLRVETIRANTGLGLEHARSQGRVGGRPTVRAPDHVETAVQLRAEGKSQQQIADVLVVGRATFGRALRSHDASAGAT